MEISFDFSNNANYSLEQNYSKLLMKYTLLKQKLENIPILTCDFTSEMGEIYKGLDMDRHLIVSGEPFLTSQQQYRLKKDKKGRDLVPYEFTYGYAITGHKSQGSQYDKALVIEEKFPFDKVEHARWLYTCCTRAVEKLVLVRS